MKIATIIYHKNISSIYLENWIKTFVDSINNQTLKEFTIYELNYGDEELNLSEKYGFLNNHKFFKVKLKNHAEAMNFLFDKCSSDNIDIIFNNNIDDFNEPERFKKQFDKIKEGYDLVSSNFRYVKEDNKQYLSKKPTRFSKLDIKKCLFKNNNIICHPSVCYSKNFYKNNRYNTDEIPVEDLNLWKKTINDYKFFILEDVLLNYRLHSNQITQITKNKNKSVLKFNNNCVGGLLKKKYNF